MITVDTKSLNMFSMKLSFIKDKSLPHAVRHTLSTAARETQEKARKDIPGKMIVRHQYTTGSVRYDKAKGIDIAQMESRVGSVAEYMDKQEVGQVKTKATEGSKVGVTVPTSFSAGLSPNARPRTKKVMTSRRHDRIHLLKRPNVTGSNKRRNAVALANASRRNAKFVYLENTEKGKTGVFAIKKRKVRGKRSYKISSVMMVHNLSKKVVRSPKNPWLEPAFDYVAKHRLQKIYDKALTYQMRNVR